MGVLALVGTAKGLFVLRGDDERRHVGFTWSFVVDHVSGLCYLEVPADGPPSRAPALLAAAVVRVARRQSHAVAGSVPRGAIRPVPAAAPAIPAGLPARLTAS